MRSKQIHGYVIALAFLVGISVGLEESDDIPWHKEKTDIVEFSDQSILEEVGKGNHIFVNFYTRNSIIAKQLHSHYKHLARLFNQNKDYRVKVGRMSIEDFPEFSYKLNLDEETSVKYFKPGQSTSSKTFDGDKTCFLQLFKWSIQFLDDKTKEELTRQFEQETGHEKKADSESEPKCNDDPVKIIREGIKDLSQKVLDLESQLDEEIKLANRDGVLMKSKSKGSIPIVVILVGAIVVFSAFIVCSRMKRRKPVNIV